MAKIIIGFVGQLASGKDAGKKYLEKNYDVASTRFSNAIRDTLTRLYLPITRGNMQDLSLDLRNRFGSDIWARVVVQDINNSPKEIMIIDGVRRLEDIACLRDLPGFNLISLETDPKIRYERMKIRNENVGDADKTYEEFMADGEREAEKEIPTVMATANYKINNNGSFDELYAQLDKIMVAIKNKNKN